MKKLPFFDLVIGGPDMSGTSTQVQDLISYFKDKGYKVRDMRGSETAALFHAEKFKEINESHDSFQDFINDEAVDEKIKNQFLSQARKILESLSYGAMQEGDRFEYINPESADLWVFEEPTKRGAGRVTRITDANMSCYGEEHDSKEVATTHSVYRYEEFYRFRKHLRKKGIPVLRSRSEESLCYQIFDSEKLPKGVSAQYYMSLPGHKIAFKNPPTHIFSVHAKEDMTPQEYAEIKAIRSGTRKLDDYEKNADFQVMVNKRYASVWLAQFYEDSCRLHGSKPPRFSHFNMLDPKEKIKAEMKQVLESNILK